MQHLRSRTDANPHRNVGVRYTVTVADRKVTASRCPPITAAISQYGGTDIPPYGFNLKLAPN